MSDYSYHSVEPRLWTVGSGEFGTDSWRPYSDWRSKSEARDEAIRLNGGTPAGEVADLRAATAANAEEIARIKAAFDEEIARVWASLDEFREAVKAAATCGYCGGLGCGRCV